MPSGEPHRPSVRCLRRGEPTVETARGNMRSMLAAVALVKKVRQDEGRVSGGARDARPLSWRRHRPGAETSRGLGLGAWGLGTRV